MTPNKEWFETYEPLDGGSVLMGDNASCKTVGIGTVKIKIHDGLVRTLTKVRHVPELTKNLISLGALDSLGCQYGAESGVLKVTKGALVVIKGQKVGNLYKMLGNTINGRVAAALGKNSKDNTKL